MRWTDGNRCLPVERALHFKKLRRRAFLKWLYYHDYLKEIITSRGHVCLWRNQPTCFHNLSLLRIKLITWNFDFSFGVQRKKSIVVNFQFAINKRPNSRMRIFITAIQLWAIPPVCDVILISWGHRITFNSAFVWFGTVDFHDTWKKKEERKEYI